MTDPPPTRRASYGPTSPTVGERGSRTRTTITDAALELFAEAAHHAATVDEIAQRSAVSRATLYQYFAGKDEIFVALMHRSGSALVELNRSLERLGADLEGYGELRRWLAGWTRVFSQFAPIFIEWIHVDTPRAAVRSPAVEFIDGHTRRFVRALEATGPYRHGDPATMAILALGIVSRTHYGAHTYDTGIPARALNDSLAIALQLALFPDTPDHVISGPAPSFELPNDSESAGRPRTPFPSSDGPRKRVPDDLGPRSAATVRRLVDAAGRVFADHGFLAANVDQVATEAHVARGTFYRYFDDTGDLLAILATEAGEAMSAPLRRLADPAIHGDPTLLRIEITALRRAHATHAGVVKAWAETTSLDPAVLGPCGEIIRAIAGSVISMFGPARPYPLDRRAAGIMWSAVLEHFPNQLRGTEHEPDESIVIEAQAAFVERVLLRR